MLYLKGTFTQVLFQMMFTTPNRQTTAMKLMVKLTIRPRKVTTEVITEGTMEAIAAAKAAKAVKLKAMLRWQMEMV